MIKDKPPRQVVTPKDQTIERLEKKQDQEQRLKRVKDMLASHETEDEDVTIEETNKALVEAGFNAEEIRNFARFLVAQETEPFELPARSPEHYKVIRDEVRELTVKLLGAGANRWTIKQALEGRIEELTTQQHILKNSPRFADLANREGSLDSDEEETD